MLKATVRTLLTHKLRLALSGLAIVFGVAFVAGTLIFTDTLGKTFEDLFSQTSADVTVTERSNFDATFAGEGQPGRGVPQSVLEAVSAVPGARAAEGQITVEGVQVVGSDGEVVGTAGAPGLGVDWSDTPGLSPLTLLTGSPPQGEGEIAVDSVTAESAKLQVGDGVRVLTPGPTLDVTVVGIFRFGESGNIAGATLTAFERDTAQRVLLRPGFWTGVGLAAEADVSRQELARRVQAVLPDGFDAKTKEQQAEEDAGDIQQGLAFINIFLLVFAGIALFVGSFIILNTFSMLVAQRTRELALLRAIGASRRQVTRSVLLEALVLGIVGATLGLGFGVLLAVGLRALFAVFGLEVPTGALVLAPRTVIASYAVGVLITVVAAYLPARRASRIPPVAALRDDVALPAASMRRRVVGGAALSAAGVALVAAGLAGAGAQPAALVGLGVMAVFIGVALLSPLVSRPVIRILGAPLRRSAVGRLSVENALRNPRRTAATASALMIGLALVSAMSVLGSSTTSSVDKLIDRSLGGDFVVSNSTQMGFSAQVAADVRDVPGVAAVGEQRFAVAEVAGGQQFVTAVSPEVLDEALAVEFVAGSGAGLNTGSDGGLLVAEQVATDKGWKVGDTVDVTFLTGAPQRLRIGGVFVRNDFLGTHVISLTTLTANGGSNRDNFVYVALENGADAAAVGSALDAKVAAFPNVELKDQTEFKDEQRNQINQLLSLIYALLVLAVIIAVLGIVNTLALSVIERTREIGLLRAVGMSRRQLRRMIRRESVVISLFGALLGLTLGIAFGIALQRVLAAEGIDVLSIPVPSLIVFLLLAGLIGVLAALWPARRAARLDVLRAVTTE
ncbi:ABC transporter permease [soil metagenome]